ncbi:MAG: hypothetical protein HFG05_03555 [Oscillibacter sp.]|nr:hypothetical protein [Oscillibacter sp.]
MANRTLPFGYRMRSGNIAVVENEAETVRMIFTSYAGGNSYEKLASGLNSRGIPYSPGRPWNKNAVARLLKDIRYLGNDTYPPIVAPEEFENRKAATCGKREHPEIKDIRILARCAVCGGPIRRERKNVWRCPSCMDGAAHIAAHITDKLLISSASEMLRALRESPDMVKFIPAECAGDSRSAELRDSFVRELDEPDFNESAARAAAIALVALQFDAMDSGDYETMRIQRLLSQAGPSDGMDAGLLRQITSAILLRSNGAVSLKLKNGQIFERNDYT